MIPGCEIHGEVTQPPEVHVQLGATGQIPCNHSISTYDTIFWYKQRQGTPPEAVISGYSTKKAGKLLMEVHKANLSTNFFISVVEMEDAVIYYCAVRDTVVGNVRGPQQKLARGVA